MLQVENQMPFTPGMFLFPDAAGVDTLYVVVKATFAVGPRGPAVAARQLPLVPADVHWGEAGTSSVRYAGEAHLPKPATDVVVVGSAHAPGGRPAPTFGASFSVGRLRKVVHVHGERVWVGGPTGLSPSRAVPVAEVPLRWERAFGGQEDQGGGTVLCEPRNPVGTGFRGKKGARELEGTPLPNLEHPAHPIRSASDRPPPCGVGFVAPSWQPRVAFAGTYDEAWQRTRAPYLPDDFDPRFLQAAPADQIYPGFLQGGEPVELTNLSADGLLKFALPTCGLAVEVEVAGQVERPRLAIETLLLEPDQGRFSLLWRGAVPCDKKGLKVSRASFRLQRLEGVAP